MVSGRLGTVVSPRLAIIEPTLLDLARVEVPTFMQGRSLVPLLREEFYDLYEDPLETRNLAGNSDYLEILDDLRRRTDELREEYGSAYAAVVERPP